MATTHPAAPFVGVSDVLAAPHPLIDFRDSDAFAARRLGLPHRVVVNLPWSAIDDRKMELPPRRVAFFVVSPGEAVEAVLAFLCATKSASTGASRAMWAVQGVLVASEAMWEDARGCGALVTAPLEPVMPAPRLWEPDPLMATVMEHVVGPAAAPGTLVDLGSGSGRDVTFLAEETAARKGRDWRFVGVDRHPASGVLCGKLWHNRGVGDMTAHVKADLRRGEEVLELVRGCSPPALACYAVRFLHRSLLETLRDGLPVGCFLAWSHFVMPEGGEWAWEHPKVKDVLGREELATTFDAAHGWRLVHSAVVEDSDHGRPLQQFVAQRVEAE